MMWLWLTIGMLVKTVHLSVFNFKKSDLYMIPLAFLGGFVVMGEIAEDYKPGDFLEPWAGMPIGFALVIAFTFKDRLLPVVTEGTLFGYSLIAGYIFFSNIYFNETEVGVFSFLLMSLCIGLAMFLIIYPRQVGKIAQTILMTLFICISIYIGYELTKGTVSFDGSDWELVVVGYSYFALIANVFYVLYFIPIPGKRQSFEERMRNISEHAKDLEEKYVAVNSTSKQIFLTLVLFFVMLLFDYLDYVSDALLISTILSFMMLVHIPPEKSKFSPYSVYKNL